jgi:DNA-binding transcriptional LysR family regulator
MLSDGDAPALIDAKLLVLFTQLYQTRSVTKAAEALGQSQPNISVGLTKLRHHFDDPLFVRTGNGMQPTPRAEALVASVAEALQSLRKVSAPARAFVPEQARQSVRVCMTDASHMTLLPRLLQHLRQSAPRLRLEATPIDERIARRLESGEADLALGIVPGLESGFYQQTFYAQDFVCLVSPRHPVIQGSLSLKTYREAVHVEVLSGLSHGLLDEALKQHRVQRDVLLQLPGFLGLATVVLQTDLVATVPRQIGEALARSGGLALLKCPVKVPSFTVKQYWHARLHHDPANRWLRGVCASLFMGG